MPPIKAVTKQFWVDLVNFFLMVGLVLTGIVIKYVLPPGSSRPRGGGQGFHGGRPVLTLWGWDRHQWGDLHFWLAVLLVIALVIHLLQHWRWIVNRFRSREA